jgi:hypothetical protein
VPHAAARLLDVGIAVNGARKRLPQGLVIERRFRHVELEAVGDELTAPDNLLAEHRVCHDVFLGAAGAPSMSL